MRYEYQCTDESQRDERRRECERLLPKLPLAGDAEWTLDPEHQIHVFGLISRTVAQGRAAVVVTHDLNLASQFATRMALVDRGRLVAQGSVAEVLRREVLEPVYGADLHFGTLRGADGSERPFVLPWAGGQSASGNPSR